MSGYDSTRDVRSALAQAHRPRLTPKERGMVIIVMGVAGSGKSTIGSLLADRLGWQFVEGDEYHSPANLEKMRAGIPLTDIDRQPWLSKLAMLIAGWNRDG